MISIRCLIVEDDELDRLALESAVEKFPFLQWIGSFTNPLEAFDTIRKDNIDLILMDIDMPIMSGLDFLQSLIHPPLCIFITSYPEYALDSFEAQAFDFIVKPLQTPRFERAINRVTEFLEMKEKAQLYDVQFVHQSLVIKEGTTIIQIPFNEIIYLEALKDYTKIITSSKQYLTLATLKTFSERLPENKFLRIHRSYSVAVSKIQKMEHNELVLEKVKLPVGKTFRKEINHYLRNHRY